MKPLEIQAHEKHRELMDEADNPLTSANRLEQLSEEDSAFVRWRVARHPNTPVTALVKLAYDDSIVVRYTAVENPHLPSQVLSDLINDEDILQLLHPTPALGGTPKKQAMAIIRKLEGFSRGWYGAPIGYVGLDWAEFVVGIRSGLVRGKRLSVFAGAGIVQGSEARSEWDEVENKISNFIKIIR